MDLDNLSPDQMEKAFKLCDIMSLEDLFVATAILESYNWDLQVSSNSYFKKAVDQIALSKEQQNNKKTVPSMNYQQKWGNNQNQQKANKEEQKPQQKSNLNEEHNTNQNYNYRVDFDDQQDPYGYSYGDQQNQEGVDYQDYEYEYADSELEKKKKIFQEHYAFQLPLSKTISEPNQMIKSLQRDRVLAQDYHRHRHQYQSNLLSRSEFMCDKIIEANPQKKNLYTQNKKKLINNKKFIVHLHKHYKSKINFTFGTFLLNLIRSHLDGKYLLVFIHHSNNQNKNKIVERILVQPQIAQFVNKNCISYGMFDNSDDYEIIQKYVPLKNLPAFALFKYNKKQQKEQFINSYSIMSNQEENCLEWMSKWMGVFMKKRPKSQNQIKAQTENQKVFQYQKISQILKDQNWEYEQMQKLYKVKRLQSKLNKEQRKKKEQQINEKAKYFQVNPQPAFQQGVSMQIKFRMPISGQSKLRIFKLSQKVQAMFDYIQCFYQEQFQEAYCEFDLTQTFPTLSLKDKKQEKLQQIFGESPRENIIVKEV